MELVNELEVEQWIPICPDLSDRSKFFHYYLVIIECPSLGKWKLLELTEVVDTPGFSGGYYVGLYTLNTVHRWADFVKQH